jgi:hypothetical protein
LKTIKFYFGKCLLSECLMPKAMTVALLVTSLGDVINSIVSICVMSPMEAKARASVVITSICVTNIANLKYSHWQKYVMRMPNAMTVALHVTLG